MTEKKKQGGLYSVVIMAAIVLVIAGWSFVMNIRMDGAGGIVDRSLAQEKESADEEDSDKSQLDTEAVAGIVKEKVAFDTELSKLDDAVTESMIVPAAEGTKIDLYMGEGTCADELLIVTAADEDDVDAEIDQVQKHLTDMQQSFQDYLPKEAKKINNAVILQSRNYIVACVTGDTEKARQVLEEQLK